MAATRPRALGLLLLALLPFLAAWRPYDTVDGSTTEPGELAVEWGAVSLQVRQPQLSMAIPQLLARLGVTRRVEVGLRGSYRLAVGNDWAGGASAGNIGFYGKWEIISGSQPHHSWPRPAVAILGGAHFLTDRALWGLDLRAAGSLWIGPVLTHVNIGFLHNGGPAVQVGAVLCAPLRIGLTPGVEVSGEVHLGGRPSVASVMASLVQKLPDLPFALDLAVRRGLTPAAADWVITAGVTMQLRLWRLGR